MDRPWHQVQETTEQEDLDLMTLILSDGGRRILHVELSNLGIDGAERNSAHLFVSASPRPFRSAI
jgi:hypothetical protein